MKRTTWLAIGLLFAFVPAAPAADGPFGGTGGHFLVAQELPASTLDPPARCTGALGGLDAVAIDAAPEAIREARLVAPVVDRTKGTMDFEAAAAGEEIGWVSVCYLASEGRDRTAVAVLELVSGGHRLRLEASGTCKEYPVPIHSRALFQSCSLHLTGSKADGVRGGTLSSGGLVPKAEPTASVTPNTWTVFVVRD